MVRGAKGVVDGRGGWAWCSGRMRLRDVMAGCGGAVLYVDGCGGGALWRDVWRDVLSGFTIRTLEWRGKYVLKNN